MIRALITFVVTAHVSAADDIEDMLGPSENPLLTIMEGQSPRQPPLDAEPRTAKATGVAKVQEEVAVGHRVVDKNLLVISTDSSGYKWQQKPWLGMDVKGMSHGDGVAEVEFRGRVVERADGAEVPVPDVRFSLVSDLTFASGMNSRIIFLSNENGEFLAQLYVQSASVVEGRDAGKIYQTSGGRIRLEKEGFVTRVIRFDYEIPEVVLHLERNQKAAHDGAVQPATRPESKSEGSDKPQPESEGGSR